MITDRLKAETRASHDRIEREAFSDRIMSGQLTLADYKLLVINNYRLHNLIESHIEAMPEVKNLTGLDFEQRKKTALLRKDVEELGLDPNKYTIEGLHLPIENAHQALGALYVLEGSTLGGAVISRALAKNANIGEHIQNFHFYGCYGDLVGMRWKAFQQVLNANAKTTEEEDEMVNSAIATFDLMTELFISSKAANAHLN